MLFGQDVNIRLSEVLLLVPKVSRDTERDSSSYIASVRCAYTNASKRLKDVASMGKNLRPVRQGNSKTIHRGREGELSHKNHKKGRNKIQDKYDSQVYKIVEQRKNNTHLVQRADEQGADKVVSEAELQSCPK